jgi:hypothetical protein
MSRAGPEPPSAQSPFARFGGYLQREDVTHPLDRHYPVVLATTNSCASPHPSRLPRLVSLVQPVFAGCCQPLLGGGPSRRYLRDPGCVAWTLTPRCSFGAYPFLPEGRRPRHRDKQLGTPNDPCTATSTGGEIAGLQSFTHVQAPQLARPPGCTHRKTPLDLGRPGHIHQAELGSLPAPSTGMATCLKRATGTAGLAPAGLRPCRLLLSPASRWNLEILSRLLSGFSRPFRFLR